MEESHQLAFERLREVYTVRVHIIICPQVCVHILICILVHIICCMFSVIAVNAVTYAQVIDILVQQVSVTTV